MWRGAHGLADKGKWAGFLARPASGTQRPETDSTGGGGYVSGSWVVHGRQPTRSARLDTKAAGRVTQPKGADAPRREPTVVVCSLEKEKTWSAR